MQEANRLYAESGGQEDSEGFQEVLGREMEEDTDVERVDCCGKDLENVEVVYAEEGVQG